MSLRSTAATFVAAVLAATIAPAQPPTPKLDASGDPLPRGAVARLGTLRHLWAGGVPIPPDFKHVVLTTRGSVVQTPMTPPHAAFERPTGPLRMAEWVVVAPGGGRAAVYAANGVTVYDLPGGKKVRRFDITDEFGFVLDADQRVCLSADGRVLAYCRPVKLKESRVQVWDVDGGQPLADYATPGRASVTLSRDGATAAVWRTNADTDDPQENAAPTVRVRDVKTGKELFRATGQVTTRPPMTVAFSPRGDLMAVGTGEGPVELWDVATGKAVWTILGGPEQERRLAFSPDGTVLAGVSTGGTVQSWSVPAGKLIRTTPPPFASRQLRGPYQITREARGLALRGPDDGVVWARVDTNGMIAWEIPSGRVLTDRTAAAEPVADIRFDDPGSDGMGVATATGVTRWHAATGARIPDPGGQPWWYDHGGHGPHAFVRLLAPDRLLRSSPAGVVAHARGADEPVSAFPAVKGLGAAGSNSFPTPDGSHLVTTAVPSSESRPGRWTVLDVPAGKLVGQGEFPTGTMSVVAAAVTPSGKRFITATNYRLVGKVPQGIVIAGRDLDTGRVLGEIVEPAASAGAVMTAMSETAAVMRTTNGRLVLVSYVGGVKGDVLDPGPAKGATDPGGPYVHPARHPGGKQFAAAWSDPVNGHYGARVYSWPGGQLLHTFIGHTGPVTAVAYSPDGTRLATGSEDTTVLVWDLSVVPKD